MKDHIVWGMIGCGDVTEVKNGPGLYLARDSVLKGVWNRTRAKAVSWTERHGHGIVYDSVQALLQDPEIDIIYIATTPDTHTDLAIRCARAGKHALVEKPVAPTLKEGMAIQQAFAQAGKKCFVCFYRRCMDRFTRLEEIIRGGEIGEVTGLQILRSTHAPSDPHEWRADPGISGGDVFTETDIHALDIMQMLMGPIRDFTCVKDDSAVTYSLCVQFASGRVASGLWNYHAAIECDRFTILGTAGRIDFPFFRNDQPLHITGLQGERDELITDSRHVGLNMEQAIVDELLSRGHFSGTLENALQTLAITSAAYHGESGAD